MLERLKINPLAENPKINFYIILQRQRLVLITCVCKLGPGAPLQFGIPYYPFTQNCALCVCLYKTAVVLCANLLAPVNLIDTRNDFAKG